jgi:hypothetical protein
VVLLVATGTVGAATGAFPVGTPLHTTGDGPGGKPVPHSGRLQLIRAADPDGGPDWGLRSFRTTRPPELRRIPGPAVHGHRLRPALLYLGDGQCQQIGRIVDGKLGVIETDGRFHALPLGPAGMCEISAGGGRSLKTATPGFVGWGLSELTSSGAPPHGYGNLPCDCGGARRVVVTGVVPPGVVAVELGGRRYPIAERRFLVVLRARPRKRLLYVIRDGRVVANPLVRR